MFLISRQHRLSVEKNLVISQWILGSLLALLGMLYSPLMAKALLIGVWIQAAGNTWVLMNLIKLPDNAAAHRVLAGLFLGELGKWAIIAGLFYIAFKRIDWISTWPYVGWMFASFVAAQTLFWVSYRFKT